MSDPVVDDLVRRLNEAIDAGSRCDDETVIVTTRLLLDLRKHLQPNGPPPPPEPEWCDVLDTIEALPFQDAREAWTRRYLERALLRVGNNVSAMARNVGIDRRYIYRLLQRHGLRDAEGTDAQEEATTAGSDADVP